MLYNGGIGPYVYSRFTCRTGRGSHNFSNGSAFLFDCFVYFYNNTMPKKKRMASMSTETRLHGELMRGRAKTSEELKTEGS